MRIIARTFERSSEHFKLMSEYELKHNLHLDIEKGLSSLSLISLNLPMRELSDFFSKESFSIGESFEEIEISYLLIKYGFYKQAMTSLRASLEIGLLSIYWSIIGKDASKFKKWLSSKFDTPYRNEKFWKVVRSNKNIEQFDQKFNLIEEIKTFNLSDYVHTKGIRFSNQGKIQRLLDGKDEYKLFREWIVDFKKVVVILEILHLLKFPPLNVKFSTQLLLSKFGTFDSIPQFGGGLGDEMSAIRSFIPEDQLLTIDELANSDDEVKYIKEWVNNLPDLTEEEINNKIIDDQKRNIEMGGFENWHSNFKLYDSRISSDMVTMLKDWAVSNNLMTVDDILNSRRSKTSN